MPKSRLVRIKIETYNLAEKLRGHKSFGDFIHKAITKTRELQQRIHQLEQENIRLKEQGEPLADQKPVNCQALLELPTGFFCAKNAPRIVELESLKICEAHLKFYRIKEKLIQDYSYPTCGAEIVIGMDGIQWMKCPIDFQRLHRWSDCKKVNCRKVKNVKIEGKIQ